MHKMVGINFMITFQMEKGVPDEGGADPLLSKSLP